MKSKLSQSVTLNYCNKSYLSLIFSLSIVIFYFVGVYVSTKSTIYCGGKPVLEKQMLIQPQNGYGSKYGQKVPDSTPTIKSSNLAFSIKPRKTTWDLTKPILIELTIQNSSNQGFYLTPVPRFILSKEDKKNFTNIEEKEIWEISNSYWSAVDLTKRNSSLMPNDYPTIFFKKHEKKTIIIDLTKLEWIKSPSSEWPYRSMREVIPHGTFNLSLQIVALSDEGTKTDKEIQTGIKFSGLSKSNEVKIEIK